MERAFVWGGGGAFVGALALTAGLYLVRLGAVRPVADSGAIVGAMVANALLFSLFALHHSVFARERVKQAVASVVPQRLIRSVYVWTASLLLVLVCVAWWPVGGEIYRVTGTAAWLLTLTQLLGVLVTARAVSAISALELAGIHAPRVGMAGLQSGGLYGLVRHPVYTGWVLMVFGTPDMTGDRLLFAVLTTAYLVAAVPWEERSLVREFGQAYRDYQRRVRWRIVPYIY